MGPLQLEVLKLAPLIFFAGLFAGVSGGLFFAETAGEKRLLIASLFLMFCIIDGIAAILMFAIS